MRVQQRHGAAAKQPNSTGICDFCDVAHRHKSDPAALESARFLAKRDEPETMRTKEKHDECFSEFAQNHDLSQNRVHQKKSSSTPKDSHRDGD